MRRTSSAACLLLLGAAAPAAAQRTAPPELIEPAALQAMIGPHDSDLALVDRMPVAVLDVRGSWVSYLQNHLPGAAWLNVETLRAGQGGLPFQLLDGESYSRLFQRLGVVPGGITVVYSAGDQQDIDATFTVWLLASAGIERVYLLNGGYARWDQEARPLSQRYPRLPPATIRARGGRFRPAVASLEEVFAATRGSGALLVDARPAEQYAGSAGAQFRRGHIPGAVNHPWKSDLEQRDLVLVWKDTTALRESYAAQGITPDRDIILYCNSSTEASHVFFALRYLLGYPRVRIYTGAWSQWAERDDLPVER